MSDDTIHIMKLRKSSYTTKNGFTLIELLVVIAIISLLSSVVLSSLSGTRERGRIAAAKSQLRSIRSGMQMLINDTGKWPNGCPPGGVSNPEVNLNSNQAGLLDRPSIGVVDTPCEWTAEEVTAWDGPYVDVDSLVDPWGRDYEFDPDYFPASCQNINASVIPAIYSEGPTQSGYDCDDIIVNIK